MSPLTDQNEAKGGAAMWQQRLGRDRSTDLLTRPPAGAQARQVDWGPLMLDPIEQLAELADLCARGFLSRDEFEYEKAKLLRR
jgi:hypothetical protein